jgi:hypothetical protein
MEKEKSKNVCSYHTKQIECGALSMQRIRLPAFMVVGNFLLSKMVVMIEVG